LKHYNKIDGLRFVAIFLVLVEHFASFIGKYISAGYSGVDLFFVISGFLITSILLKSNNGSFKKDYTNFLGRRTLRIFPIYYLTLILLWLMNLDSVRSNIVSLLTYTWNYRLVKFHLSTSPVVVFWSLSVEEQFYLFWPLVILATRKKPAILLFAILIVVLLGYVQLTFNVFPSISGYNNFGLFTRMSSLGIGALGAFVSLNYALPNKIFNSKIIEWCMFLLLIIGLITSIQLRYIITGVCFAFFVLKAAYFNYSLRPLNIFLSNKYIRYVGKISYGIYLFHMPIAYYLTKYVFDPFFWTKINFSSLGEFSKLEFHPWIIKFPLYSVITILIAGLSFKFIEKPILSLKDKWFKYKVAATNQYETGDKKNTF
jgi:peptidoglycan/LPS O-acetylase OafA/YrhL